MSDQPAFHHHTAPPTYRVALAERAGLFQRLREAGDRRLIVVEAPAGYGKTWLLGRWYNELRASGARVAWLGVEHADANHFLGLLVAALSRAGIDVGRLETQADHGFADVLPEAAVAAIAAVLEAASQPTVVLVDDLHRLPRDVVHGLLARLIGEAPANARFVCSGRDCSALPRAALRARGDLFEIDNELLRFDANEAGELFPAIDRTQLDSLLARTEGWPVALQLARLWLEAKPGRSSLIDGFSGRTSEVAEYLTEQVLADLPPELQATLEQVATVDQLNPELVAAITGSEQDWRRLLGERRLEHFLVPLDQERYWFRLHHLLLDFLRARRRERGVDARTLHARASDWYERHGELKEAVTHAVHAGDVSRAAEMVQRTGGWELVLFGGTIRMRALLNALPAARLAEFPRVQLSQAFLAAKEGDLDRGIRSYDAIAAKHGDSNDPALRRDLLVVGYLVGRYADRPVERGDLEVLYRRFESLPATDDAARAALLNTACLMALGIGDMPAALDACLRATKEMRRIGSVLGLNYCLLHLGLTRLHLGERREAEATLSEAAAMAEENFGKDSGLKAIADVHLAIALHARGEIAEAAERLATPLSHIESADGWLDAYAEGYQTAISNSLARGDVKGVDALVRRMVRVARARGLPRLERLALIHEQRLAATQQLADWNAEGWRETPFAWREHHATGVSLTLAALISHRAAEAVPILDDLQRAAAAAGRRRDARVLRALRAAVTLELDGEAAAIEPFVEGLDDALREDDVQHLVDLGPALLPLLQTAWAWSREHWPSARGRQVLATAATALARSSAPTDVPLVLSAREFEVLVELATGAPNKLIARHLQMNENTVKYHLKNIFAKLQVRHRAEALSAARARGVLR
jgi:LuxR family maltose regulon positive regulatory protein